MAACALAACARHAQANSQLSDLLQWFVADGASETTVAKGVAEPAVSPPVSEATEVGVLGDRTSTLFQLTLTRGVTAEVYTLADPYRVIVDLPGVGFKLPPDAGRDARGLVSAFRYGQFDEGKARIVLDTQGPVAIAKAAMTKARSGSGVVLTIELAPTAAAAFGEGTGGGRRAAPVETASPLPAKPKTPPISRSS